MNVLISALPLLIFALLLLVLRVRLFVAAPFVFLVTIGLALFQALPFTAIGPLLAKQALLSLDILLIIFGAVFFLSYLKHVGALQRLETALEQLSPDHRIRAILLAWLFGGFLEGTSGFGTPAVIVAPLLVGIGFAPVTAVVVCLFANSTAVTFGAAGTPIRVGFEGLPTAQVGELAAIIQIVPGLLIPLLILAFISSEKVAPKKEKWRYFLKALPWSFFAGVAFLTPFVFFAHHSSELPSIMGGAIGLFIATISLRRTNLLSLARAFTPYLALVTILILGKIIFSEYRWLFSLGHNLNHSIQLFNPGFAFLTTVALLLAFQQEPRTNLTVLVRESITPLFKTTITIFFVVGITYTYSASGMLRILAEPLLTPHLPLFSAFIGAFGTFLAGSATVSNLLLGPPQFSAAEALSIAPQLVLALQLAGAAAGNMIALPNIVAVAAAVGLQDHENQILRLLLLPCLLYLALVTLIAQMIPK